MDTALPPSSQILAAALAIASQGTRIFPCAPGEKWPAIQAWPRNATTDETAIRNWWTNTPKANLAMPTGEPAGVVVIDLDIDSEKGGDGVASFEALRAGREMPETRTHKTPRGGLHYFFKHPGGQVPNSAGKLAEHVDVRGDGGYVILPPSQTDRGCYSVKCSALLAPMPPWLIDYVRKKPYTAPIVTPLTSPPPRNYAEQALANEVTTVRHALSGKRNATLNSAAFSIGQLIGANLLDRGTAENELAAAALATGLPQHEVTTTLKGAIGRGMLEPRHVPPPRQSPASRTGTAESPPAPPKGAGAVTEAPVLPDEDAQLRTMLLLQGEKMGAFVDPIEAAAAGQPYPTTDAGFAERLAFHMKEKAFYHAGRGKWFAWDGMRWREACGEIENYAVETARRIKTEACKYPAQEKAGQEVASRLFKFALQCEEIGQINAAVKLAVSVPGMAKQATELDTNPMLLCCGNGTLNLETGELRPHREDDYITKWTPVEYDPNAHAPLFDKFMENATGGDVGFETYLRRAAGYSLTGNISEKCLFFLYNADTDTGKTTFLEALRTAAGEYSVVIDFELLAGEGGAGAHSKPRYDLAKLVGARFVSCSEIRRGQRIDSAMVKRMTGGDTIRARDCGEKSFLFSPSHKIWIAANDPPSCPDDDAGFWNRMRRVPFGHRVPKEKRDPAVLKSLTTPGHPAARAFLAWAVRGAIEWANHGVGTCPIVEESTAAYQVESDPLQNFFADCCRFSPEVWDANGTIRRAYEGWAEAEGINRKYWISPKAFGGRLGAKGCIPTRKGTGRAWQGIEIIEHEKDTVCR